MADARNIFTRLFERFWYHVCLRRIFRRSLPVWRSKFVRPVFSGAAGGSLDLGRSIMGLCTGLNLERSLSVRSPRANFRDTLEPVLFPLLDSRIAID